MSLASGGDVLDGRASVLASALEESGVSIHGPVFAPPYRTTVYHRVGRSSFRDSKPSFAPIAEKLFAAGFYDVNGYDHAGFTALCTGLDGYQKVDLEYAHWLVSHGADLGCKPASTARGMISQSSTARHHLAGYLGCYIGDFLFDRSELPWMSLMDVIEDLSSLDSFGSTFCELLTSVLVEAVYDDCVCACSASGCSPVISLLKGLKQHFWWRELSGRFHDLVGGAAANLIMVIASELGFLAGVQARLGHQLIQALSFERLMGLRHTCCYIELFPTEFARPDAFIMREQEEIDEIRAEEAILIERFHLLVKELQGQFDKLAVPFSRFLIEYWEPRMQQEEELDEIASLDEEEVRKVEAIGVVLDRRGPFKSRGTKDELEDGESEDGDSENGESEDGDSGDGDSEDGKGKDAETDNEGGSEHEQPCPPTSSQAVYKTGAALGDRLDPRTSRGRSKSI